MMVLNLLLKRRGVLRNAYKHSGEAQHFYRLQELEYLLKHLPDDQDGSSCASGLGERGDGYPRGLGDAGIVDYGRYKPSGAALGATLEGYASRPVDKEHGCAECGVSGGYALYCVACAEKYVSKGARMTKDETKNESHGWKIVPIKPTNEMI